MTAVVTASQEQGGRPDASNGAPRPVSLYMKEASEEDFAPMGVAKAFVGRNRELEELTSAFDEVRGGRGSLFLLVGGAGIGKTRLADEAARAAQQAGLLTLWGRCWETGGAPAYWPWIQVLRELARERNVTELLTAAGPAAPMLAALVPELAAAQTGMPAEPLDAYAAEGRFRLFDAVSAVLRAAAREQPLFVVLDDVHTADPSSLALLHFVARNLRGVRVLLVGTYRDEEARANPELGRTLADIAREGTYLPLTPLGSEEIALLIARLSGKPADATMVESVRRTTEGNPLFLDELLRLLIQRGELGGAAASGLGSLPVPDSVRDVIRRRLMRLPGTARDLLATASVLGRDFTSGALAGMVGEPAPVLESHLHEVERTNLLVALAAGSYRFSHVLVRETLYRDLPVHRRAELHLQAASLLEGGVGGGEILSEAAHHRLAALPMGDALAAASVVQRAADRAMAMLAFEDAAALLEQGLAALEQTRGFPPRLACELRLLAGLARMRGGDSQGGRRLNVAAAEDARRLGDGELFAGAALGYGAEVMLARTDPTLVRLLEEALTVLPPGPSGLRAQVMARLAAARQPCPEPQQPIAVAREAVAMARAAQSPEILRGVLYFAGSAMAEYAPPEERALISAELVAMARAAGDRPQVLRGECRLVFDYLEMGDIERCLQSLDGYDQVAEAFRQPRHLWPGRLMRAMVAAALGRFADADRFTGEARAIAVADPDDMTRPCVVWHRVCHVMALEKIEDLDDTLAEVEAELASRPFDTTSSDILNMSKGMLLARLTDQREEVARCLAFLEPDQNFLRDEFGPMASLADAVAHIGDQRMAAVLYKNLLRGPDRIGTHGRTGFYCAGPTNAALGLLAGTLGRPDEAIDRLEQGAARASALGLRPSVANSRWWQARFVVERGGPGAPEQARELLTQVDQLAASLRLRTLARRAADLRAEIDDRSGGRRSPKPATAPPIELAREGDYWTVMVNGETARLRDTRGLQMLAELLQHPGREFHALALMGSDSDAVDGGDAGALLDEEAIGDYRRRLEALEDELAEAERWADAGRAARARDEREAIGEELARGVGLGGRARRAGSAAERARVNVQRRIRGAIRKIAETLPTTGAYLDRAIKTGAFCSYDPY